MGLTMGTGPFGPRATGRFNFTRQGPAHVLYLDPSPKRVRTQFAGETIADSRGAMLLHETGLLPIYYFPRADVREDLLEPTGTTSHCPFKGDASYWSVRVGDRVATDAVWGYPAPLDAAPAGLDDLMAFYFDRMDAWFEEDEQIDVHPRDPFTRVDVRVSSLHVRARLGDLVLAESRRPRLLFETGLPVRYYLPPEDVDRAQLVASATVTRCPYKGTATTWSLRDGSASDVGWSYADPALEAVPVAGHFCFDPAKATVEVDGKALGVAE